MSAAHFDGVTTRLEFDDCQLHSTFHDRNDGAFCAVVDDGTDADNQASLDAMAREICQKVNTHASLVHALQAVYDLRSAVMNEADKRGERFSAGDRICRFTEAFTKARDALLAASKMAQS